MEPTSSIYLVRTLKTKKGDGIDQNSTLFPAAEWFIEFDGDDFGLLQEIVSTLCFAERQLMPFAASVCVACWKVEIGQKLERLTQCVVLHPQKSSLDASEGFTGIMQPVFDVVRNSNGTYTRQNLEPVLIGNIGADPQPLRANTTETGWNGSFALQIAFGVLQGSPRKMVFQNAVEKDEIEWDEKGRISIPLNSHLYRKRWPAFKKTLRVVLPFLANVRFDDEGILRRCEQFTNRMTLNCVSDHQAIRAKRAEFSQVASANWMDRIKALIIGMKQHRQDCARFTFTPEYENFHWDGILSVLKAPLDGRESGFNSLTGVLSRVILPRDPEMSRVPVINPDNPFEIVGPVAEVDPILDFYFEYLSYLFQKTPDLGFVSGQRAAERIQREYGASASNLSAAEYTNIFTRYQIEAGAAFRVMFCISLEQAGIALNNLLCELVWFERELHLKRTKRAPRIASDRTTGLLGPANIEKPRIYKAKKALNTLALYRQNVIDYEGYSVFVPMDYTYRQLRSYFYDQLLAFVAQPVPSPETLEKRNRRFRWDNTIHPLTPEEEDAEAVAMLEEVEERAKIGERFLYRVVQTYANTKNIPTPPAFIVDPLLRRAADEINPNDVPPNLGVQLAISFATNATNLRYKDVTVFSPGNFAKLAIKLRDGTPTTVFDYTGVVGL